MSSKIFEAAKVSHGRWSEANVRFLEHVESHPEYRRRASFATFHRDAPFRDNMPLQSWPIFVSEARHREIDHIAVGLDRLFRGVLERFFDNDPARIAEFYTIDDSQFYPFEVTEELVAFLMAEPSGLEGAPSRGDYIETADGRLQCIEYNAGSGLGGWQIEIAEPLILAEPPIARFLAAEGLEPMHQKTIRALFRHFIAETIDRGVWTSGDLNVAIIVHPHQDDEVAVHSREIYERELRHALEEDGRPSGGRIFLCAFEDLDEKTGVLALDGKPVHVAFEQHDGDGDSRLANWYAKAGRLNLYSGQVGFLLSDKRNLALLSGNAASDLFTAEERRLIERHIPWTRFIRPGEVEVGGNKVSLTEHIRAHRDSLVIKKATSMGGRHVFVGPFQSESEWDEVLERALGESDWIVQEYLETDPFCFRHGEEGVAPFDITWGFFVFGGEYGGIFCRLLARDLSTGVINTSQGSEVAVVLDVAT